MADALIFRTRRLDNPLARRAILPGIASRAGITMTPQELKRARKTLGLTQEEFAHWLGVSRKMTVSDWERGIKPVSETAAILVQAYLDGWRPKHADA